MLQAKQKHIQHGRLIHTIRAVLPRDDWRARWLCLGVGTQQEAAGSDVAASIHSS